MNVFEAVKQSVTTRQAAESYGFKVNRAGMMVCPFHKDNHPSMKADRRYFCFGCGATGDVVDFVARLSGLGLREAAVKLAGDFSIPYDSKGRASPEKEPIKAKLQQIQQSRQEERDCYRILCDYLHLLYGWKETHAPKPEDGEWNPLFVEALQNITHVEYLLDILLSGETGEKEQLLREHGKEARGLGKRISEINARQGSNNITDIRDYKTGWERGRSQGYAGNDR